MELFLCMVITGW